MLLICLEYLSWSFWCWWRILGTNQTFGYYFVSLLSSRLHISAKELDGQSLVAALIKLFISPMRFSSSPILCSLAFQTYFKLGMIVIYLNKL
ncbi:unnamed protein product [Moneuplotes crassus]|uniref:Uncharacterized protein n=1 Tax=Euplotes crassus TaxID=5936 RepID=A0AAD1U784_EUPCR|nr:unnamed protein product [Moneuplotes crassus]